MTVRTLKDLVFVLCLLAILIVLHIIMNDSSNNVAYDTIKLPGTLCLDTDLNSSKETPEKYFRPLTTATQLNYKRYLVYHCSEGLCGGIGDRFRGIVNSFILALLTGRTFGIHHMMPCPLQNFLKPHRYQWLISNRIRKNAKSSRVYDLIDHQELPSPNMTSYLKEDVVYLRLNGDITTKLMKQADVPIRIPWLPKFSVAELFDSILSQLFVITDSFQNDMDRFRRQHVGNNKTVCVHYRAGKNPTIPRDAYRYGQKYLGHVWNFLTKYNKTGHVIYIATDSENVKEQGRSKFPDRFIDIPGKITHVDQSRDNSECNGFRKGIMEHQFLQQCDVIHLTPSGYSRTAALLRKTSNFMFCLRETGISMCSKANLLHMLVS